MSRQDNALIIRELADLLRKYQGQAHECIDIGGEMGRIRGAADRMMFENATLTAQLEHLYIPGEFKCGKCGFELIQSSINMGSGAVTTDNKNDTKCLNCNVIMWRVTWQSVAEKGMASIDELFEDNKNKAAQLELTKGLQPNYFHDSHKAVDAFWKVWNEVGEPHKHGVYESTWMALRAAIEAIEDTNND